MIIKQYDQKQRDIFLCVISGVAQCLVLKNTVVLIKLNQCLTKSATIKLVE